MSPEDAASGDTGELNDVVEHHELLRSERVYEGRVWDVRKETFDYNGHAVERDFMDHTGAVAVLALDEQERVLLIRQYRHPIHTREWELPAGLLDIVGEDPLLAAQRELAEEADLTAGSWRLLSEYFASPGGTNEAMRVYLARDVAATPQAYDRTEEEADIEVRWVPLADAVTAVLERRLQNPTLAIAVLAAWTARQRGWDTLGDAQEPWTRHPRFTG